MHKIICPNCHSIGSTNKPSGHIHCPACNEIFNIDQGSTLYSGRPSWTTLALPLAIAAVLVFLGFQGWTNPQLSAMQMLYWFGGLIASLAVLKWLFTHYHITTSSVTVSSGALTKIEHQISMRDVKSVKISQTMLDRFCKKSGVELYTAAHKSADIRLNSLPYEIALYIKKMANNQSL